MDPTIIKQLVDLQRSQFEHWVLACAAKDLAFYNQFAGLICVAHEGARFSIYDFEVPLDNVVYSAIRQTRELMVGAEVDELPAGLVYASIQQIYASPRVPDPKKGAALSILQHELPQVLQRVNQVLTTQDIDKLTPVVSLGVSHWISKSRMQKLNLATTSARFDPETYAELISSIQRHVLSAAEEEHVFAFGHGINSKQETVQRISSGIAKLDTALGGGFGQGEGTLVVAPQGAGKTVAATQLAGVFGMQRKAGLLITTEQKHLHLEPRIISNFGNIPFAMIKDGIDRDRLPPDIVRRMAAVEENLRPYLHICNWSSDRGQSIKSSLDAEIAKFIREHGKIEWFIFDWIGGALGELSNRDMQVLRLIFKTAADHICTIASKYNIPAIAFAQANMAQAKNKPRVDATMIAENKQLGEKFTNGLGISALEEAFDPNGGGKPAFLERQFINIWKARKSEGGLIAVKRDFGYQRFAEI